MNLGKENKWKDEVNRVDDSWANAEQNNRNLPAVGGKEAESKGCKYVAHKVDCLDRRPGEERGVNFSKLSQNTLSKLSISKGYVEVIPVYEGGDDEAETNTSH